MIIVSACLAGCNCRYDGGNNKIKEIAEMVRNNKALAVCPEELGSLSTPRTPCEIKIIANQVRVYTKDDDDVTEEFKKGAEKTLEIAKTYDVEYIVLKSNSPSCGFGKIYDGTFTGRLVEGNGLTAQLLDQNGYKIYSEKDFHD